MMLQASKYLLMILGLCCAISCNKDKPISTDNEYFKDYFDHDYEKIKLLENQLVQPKNEKDSIHIIRSLEVLYIKYYQNKIKIINQSKDDLTKQNNKNIQLLWVLGISLLFTHLLLFMQIKTQKELKKSYQEMLKIKNNRDRIYSIIAHDLSSPITSYQSIVQTINVFIKEKDFAQLDKISAQIDRNGYALNLTLKNLLQWTKIEQLELNLSELNIDVLIKQSISIYEGLITSKKLNVVIKSSSDSYVISDINILATIIRNLIDNAIKNSTDESIIEVETTVSEDWFSISVQNPVNIPDHKKQGLKEYFEIKDEQNLTQNNVGLGLNLIKDFTAKLGGKVSVNTIGENIQFEIVIPYSKTT